MEIKLTSLAPYSSLEYKNTSKEWKFCHGIPTLGCIFRPARSKSMKNPPNGNNSLTVNVYFIFL
jgi:hypothetical protein